MPSRKDRYKVEACEDAISATLKAYKLNTEEKAELIKQLLLDSFRFDIEVRGLKYWIDVVENLGNVKFHKTTAYK